MESWIVEYITVGAGALGALGAAYFGVRTFRRKPPAAETPKPESERSAPTVAASESGSFVSGLKRTRDALRKFREKTPTSKDALRESLEEALLSADVGVRTTEALLSRVFTPEQGTDAEHIRELLEQEVVRLITPPGSSESAVKPRVISFVGVNGVGKTTTVGKLAALLNAQGKRVLLGAADTFRAAAAQQLSVWAERSSAQFVSGREGGDPGAVAYDAVAAGKSRDVDYVLIDTAGRLHTKSNLMQELARVHRVVQKVMPDAPHDVWLVVDGTLGQNSVKQAEEFKRTLGLTGVIVTKLDGTAKGGAVLSIVHDLGLPVRYIGLGEKVGDLKPFDPRAFAAALFGAS